MVKTLPSNARDTGSICGWIAKISHASKSKKKKKTQTKTKKKKKKKKKETEAIL